MSQWLQVRPIIDEMVNRQFDTAEFKKLFAVPLTPGRVKVYQNHMTYYAANRRDCWSFVAGKAPLDVKRAIWEHEKDELIHDERMGRAHVTEDDLQAGDESLLAPGAKAAFYAWLYCARENRGSKGWFIPTFSNGATTTPSSKAADWWSAGSASKEPSSAPRKRRKISRLRFTRLPTKITRISLSRSSRGTLTAKQRRRRCSRRLGMDW